MRTETQESLDNLFTARWNLPTAAKNCGMSYDEMRICLLYTSDAADE